MQPVRHLVTMSLIARGGCTPKNIRVHCRNVVRRVHVASVVRRTYSFIKNKYTYIFNKNSLTDYSYSYEAKQCQSPSIIRVINLNHEHQTKVHEHVPEMLCVVQSTFNDDISCYGVYLVK